MSFVPLPTKAQLFSQACSKKYKGTCLTRYFLCGLLYCWDYSWVSVEWRWTALLWEAKTCDYFHEDSKGIRKGIILYAYLDPFPQESDEMYRRHFYSCNMSRPIRFSNEYLGGLSYSPCYKLWTCRENSMAYSYAMVICTCECNAKIFVVWSMFMLWDIQLIFDWK